jgi:hypothetical protein
MVETINVQMSHSPKIQYTTEQNKNELVSFIYAGVELIQLKEKDCNKKLIQNIMKKGDGEAMVVCSEISAIPLNVAGQLNKDYEELMVESWFAQLDSICDKICDYIANNLSSLNYSTADDYHGVLMRF